MRVLFLHSNFPAQYRHVALALAQDPRNQVVFGTKNQDVNIPGIYKAIFEPNRESPSHNPSLCSQSRKCSIAWASCV